MERSSLTWSQNWFSKLVLPAAEYSTFSLSRSYFSNWRLMSARGQRNAAMRRRGFIPNDTNIHSSSQSVPLSPFGTDLPQPRRKFNNPPSHGRKLRQDLGPLHVMHLLIGGPAHRREFNAIARCTFRSMGEQPNGRTFLPTPSGSWSSQAFRWRLRGGNS